MDTLKMTKSMKLCHITVTEKDYKILNLIATIFLFQSSQNSLRHIYQYTEMLLCIAKSTVDSVINYNSYFEFEFQAIIIIMSIKIHTLF